MKTLFLTLFTIYSIFLTSLQKKDTPPLSYVLNQEKSTVEWSGSTPKVSHQGSFSVFCKTLDVADGQIKGGTFVIPIASMKNFDLPKTIKPVLLKHLKSKDFFHVALYPEATFTITKVESFIPATPDAIAGSNAFVTGEFTLLGTTKPISFPAAINLAEDSMRVEAKFKLDRTQWGMIHAADPTLKNRYIYPEVDIHLKLLGSRS